LGRTHERGRALEDRQVPGFGQDVAWLAELLWLRSGSGGPVRISTGSVPDGYRAVERFAVVPSLRKAEFLVPLRSRKTAWAALSRYNALRPLRTRIPRRLLSTGMLLGLAQPLLRDRLVVCVARDTPADELADLLVADHLRRLLGVRDLAMAIGIGSRDAYRKPTLQLFDPDGRALGYAKAGWNRVTARLVRNEARAMAALSTRPLETVSVPALLAAGAWNGLELVVSAPLPDGVRRYRPFDVVPPLKITREIAAAAAGTRTLPLAASPYWARVRRETEAAEKNGLRTVLAGYLRAVEERWGQLPLEFGAWHGDWVSWNLARNGGRLHAWDWEHSGDDVPVGFDVTHWHFQMALVREGRGVVEAVRRCTELGLPLLVELGVAPKAAPAVVACYLLEILLRDWRSVQAGGNWTARLYPGILPVLADRAAAVREGAERR